jgi:hypothetical protein
MKNRIISVSLLALVTTAVVIAAPRLEEGSAEAGELDGGTASGTEFLMVGNVRVLHGPWHARLIAVFVEPREFTIANIRSIFLSLSEKHSREDLLGVYAFSQVGEVERVAREFAEIQLTGKLRGSCGNRLDDDLLRLSAQYARSELTENLTYVPETGEPVHINLKESLGECSSSGDASVDLVVASRLGCKDLVQNLLNAGADPDAKSKYGSAALVEASLMGQTGIADLLLASGADINQTSAAGWTPLRAAISMNRNSLVALLFSRGADVNIKSEDGRTALTAAVLQQNVDFVKRLLAHGADITVKDADGRTPLGIAGEVQNESLIRLLKGAGARQ